MTADTKTRWIGTGTSSAPDAATAGAAAARDALRGTDPKLVVVFASNSYDLAALLAAVNQTTGGVPLIGCTTGGEISKAGVKHSSVVVTVFGGEGFRAVTGSQQISVGPDAAGKALGSMTSATPGKNAVFMVLLDGLAPGHEQILRGLYTKLGEKIPMVGGAASDGDVHEITRQFHDGQVLTDAVVGAFIESDGPFGIGTGHGWERVGEPMTITKSVGGRVFLLDGKPALDAYLDRLNAPANVYTDVEAFREFVAVRPLSIKRHTGGEIRGMVEKPDFENRSLYCAGDLPQGGQAWVMQGDSSSVLSATKDSVAQAVDNLGGAAPLGIIAFDCHGRLGHLGKDGSRREVETLASYAGAGALAGFYTYGEVARTRGMHGYHHMTLVTLAIA